MADVPSSSRDPATWRDVASFNMKELRALLSRLDVPVVGRVTKVDLQYKVCVALKISTAGESSTSDPLTPLEKSSIPPDVLPFYR